MVRQFLQRLRIPVTFSLLSLTIAGSCHAAIINGETKNYQISQENFINPERGFYINSLTRHQDSPLTQSQVTTAKQKNISLIRRIYVIPQYRYSSLPASFLELVKQDLNVARQAGIKLVVRFAYNFFLNMFQVFNNFFVVLNS